MHDRLLPKGRNVVMELSVWILSILLTAVLIWFVISRRQSLQTDLGQRDSICYWATGHLLAEHANPYDEGNALSLERSAGYVEAKPLVLRMPPWSLFLLLPLGVLSAFSAWLVWVGISVAALFVSMRLCRRIYCRDLRRDLVSIVGYTFAPVLACLVAGQFGLILLLGIALFLWLEPKHPFVAGLCLIFPFAKPHLLVIFWLVLVLYVIQKRRYAVAAGFFLSFLVAVGIALSFDLSIFQHYRSMIRAESIGTLFVPALSGVLRLVFFRHHFWVQFVPLALSAVWAIPYFLRHRGEWSWQQHAPALFIISMVVTPYSWFTDEVLLLPAILQALAWIHRSLKTMSLVSWFLIAFLAMLNGFLLLIINAKIPFSGGLYFWSSLVWCGWYFYGARRDRITECKCDAKGSESLEVVL